MSKKSVKAIEDAPRSHVRRIRAGDEWKAPVDSHEFGSYCVQSAPASAQIKLRPPLVNSQDSRIIFESHTNGKAKKK